jgi:hypothetical protein
LLEKFCVEMSRNNGKQMLKDLIEKTEAFNHSMSSKSKDNVTEQILFCQNGIDNLNISSKNNNSTFVNDKKTNLINEELMVDIVSNGYKYHTSSFELNAVQQCCVVSIISPYAFTIQLTRDSLEYDEFFKTMKY